MSKYISVFMACILLAGVLTIGFAAAKPTEKVPVIVGFKGRPDSDLILSKGGEIKYMYNIIPAIACSLPQQAIDALEKNPVITYIDPDYEVHITNVPNDLNSELWGLHNTGQTGGTPDSDIDAPEAWDIHTGDSSLVIAVIDTGVDYDHPDLEANIWTNPVEIPGDGLDNDNNGYVDDVYGWDFINGDNDPMDDHSHGTHCAGTIAAVGNNGVGVVGVNWKAKIMALKFLSADGSGSTSDAIIAVEYATIMKRDYGVPIIAMSNSWGGWGYEQGLKDAITAADNEGILFVAAAGNGLLGIGLNNDLLPHYPSSFEVPNVIAVAATDHNDALALFSNYGYKSVDLAAPGVNIYSTIPSGYDYMNGTSMATPHVSGVAALIKAQAPGYTHHEIRDLIFSSVDVKWDLIGMMVTAGRLNAFNALDSIPTGNQPPACTLTATPSSGDAPLTTVFTMTANDPDGSIASWELNVDNDGPPEYSGGGVPPETQSHTYNDPGTYTAELTVWDDDGTTAYATTDVTVEGISDYADNVANADIPVSGSVLGSFSDTHTSDNVYEAIEESKTSGKPINKKSELEHKWTINVVSGTKTKVTFNVEAYHTTNSEIDDFTFAYSTDDSSYTDMITVTKTADDNTPQAVELPSYLSGTVYIRVKDTDSTGGNSKKDIIYIDHMYIRSEFGPPSYGVTVTIDEASRTVIPGEGTTFTVRVKNTGGLEASYSVIMSGTAVDEHTITVGPLNWNTGPLTPGAEDVQSVTITTTMGAPEAEYTLTATATCDQDASIDDSATSNLIVSSVTNRIHVESIEMSLSERTAGKNTFTYATVVVTIFDADDNPVVGATVEGYWSDATTDVDSGVTDAAGQVSFNSDSVKNAPSGTTFTFTVDDVTLAGWEYRPEDNIETSDNITIP